MRLATLLLLMLCVGCAPKRKVRIYVVPAPPSHFCEDNYEYYDGSNEEPRECPWIDCTSTDQSRCTNVGE